jgi:uncharacterized protein (TIGR02302 family)
LDPTLPEKPDPQHSRLTQAAQRARAALLWERSWPHLARLLGVVGLFLALSWAGLWLVLPLNARLVALALITVLLLVAAWPLRTFRWPRRAEVLARLDRSSGLRHRPVTALSDSLSLTDPTARALWEAQRARTLASLGYVRAGAPQPRLVRHDPWALRAAVILAVVVTFIAAAGERSARIAAAFDWNGALSPADIRLDAWITPPAYTGRPPVILSGVREGNMHAAALAVPAGSILTVRTSAAELDVALTGAIAETPRPGEAPPQGTSEKTFTITGHASAQVRAPRQQPAWQFDATADKPPTIALAREPERQARGSLQLAYKLEDDFGVTQAQAHFALRNPAAAADGAAARPLFAPPDFPLALPNARTRSGVGQTVKDLSEDPYAGAEMTLTLSARDEAGNEGRSEPAQVRLPERLFTKPLARALIEQRRMLALDANQNPRVQAALDALLIAPEIFTPEAGHYLGLRSVAHQLDGARTDDQLREVVSALWALALSIEDGDTSDAEKALRAAQEALKQALERGASDEEIKKLTENLRAALDNFLRQLAEQMKNNPQQLARPLDQNTKMLRQQDLNSMIDRMERLSRSGDKDAARQMLEQLQQMLENLQMAQPGQNGGDDEMQEAMNELGDIIRKQQQLRDKTYKQGQDQRRDRQRGRQNQPSMDDLAQDQQTLRDRLQKLQEQLAKRGMGQQGQKGQRGQKGQQGEPGQGEQGDGGQGDQDGDGLGDADEAMGDAGGRLGQGNAEGAVGSQGKALEALRRGAQQLAQSMQNGDGEGDEPGPGDRPGRQQSSGNRTDPLGRPLRGRELGDDLTVKIPGEIDVQRVRRILEELRRRAGESARPQIELDYIERLLKDF